MKLKLIAAAVALASVAGVNQAEAAITAPSTGNGSLFLTAWDATANKMYVRDLGVLMNSFLPNSIGPMPGDNTMAGTMTPETGIAPMTFAGDALFASTFTGSLAGNIQWNISAGDALNGGSYGINRLFTTAALPAANTPATFTFTNGGVNTATTNIQNFASVTAVGMGCAGAVVSCAGQYSVYQPGAGSPGLVTNGVLGGSDLGFYYIARSAVSNFSAATKVAFANSRNMATWHLNADGSVAYSLAPAVAAVPIPAAAWLFGSGLLGLVGVARRRKA